METIMYKNFEAPGQTGVFCFLNMESCFACSEFMKEIKKYDTKKWTMVVMGDDDSEDFKQKGFSVPLTRIYIGGRIEWEEGGILYSEQVRQIYEVLSRYSEQSSTGKPIASVKMPKILQAKQRDVSVQFFVADEFMSMNLVGQDVEIRKDQILVMYPDNTIEILNSNDFERRFVV